MVQILDAALIGGNSAIPAAIVAGMECYQKFEFL